MKKQADEINTPILPNSAIQEDLIILQDAHQYRNWLFSLISPYLGEEILEIGAGIGNYTELLAQKGRVCASDYDPSFIEHINVKFSHNTNIRSTLLDLNHISEGVIEPLSTNSFDTIVALNVLEHIKDDVKALINLKALLYDSGNIILIIPAVPQLFNYLDRSYNHFRRYSKQYCINFFAPHFNIVALKYFNLFGIIGWYLNGSILKKRNLPSRQTKLFNLIVPILSFYESLIPPPIGLSLMVILKKRKENVLY